MNPMKRLHILSRLLIVVFSLFILAVLPMASTAQAAPTRSGLALSPHGPIICPSMTLNPTSGQYGTSVTVTVDTGNRSGVGGNPVIITFNPPGGPIVASGVDGPNGAFTATFLVPSLAPGNYTVQATGFGVPRFCNPVTQIFQMTCANPGLTINPYWVKNGQTLTLSGCGFKPYAVITITGGMNGTALADSNGNFTFSRIHFDLYKACYLVRATDGTHTAQSGYCDSPN